MDKIRILLTDDDEDDRFFMRNAIEQHIKKAVVYEAKDGSDALKQLTAMADRPSVHLILLDVNMPLMNGFELLDRLRVSPVLKYIPTIMLSTSNHVDQVSAAYEKGANAYLIKPANVAGYDNLVKAIEICFLQIVR